MMSKVRVLIVEDNLIVAQDMANYLTKTGCHILAIIDNVQEGRRAMETYQVDIALIDIQLRGEEDGIDLAKFINQNYSLPLIFVTSFMDKKTVTKALEARPSAYLVKPYNPAELQIAIDVALSNYEEKNIAKINDDNLEKNASHHAVNGSIFIRDKHRLERVAYNDILWLKAESSYVEVATRYKKYLLTTDTLGSMLDKLNCDWLLRVHRSYAVNKLEVTAIEGNRLEINKQYIPIGKNHRTDLKHHFLIP